MSRVGGDHRPELRVAIEAVAVSANVRTAPFVGTPVDAHGAGIVGPRAAELLVGVPVQLDRLVNAANVQVMEEPDRTDQPMKLRVLTAPREAEEADLVAGVVVEDEEAVRLGPQAPSSAIQSWPERTAGFSIDMTRQE